jgi:hypothetical protein
MASASDLQGTRRSVPSGKAAPTEGALSHPVLLTLTLVTLMLPVSFTLGSFLMSPSRLLFLITMPVLLTGLLAGRFGRVTAVDVIFLLFVAWRTMTPWVTNPARALEYTGSNLLVILGAYLVGRASVRNVTDFYLAFRLIIFFVIVSFPFALSESITGDMVLPKYIEMIPGVNSVEDVDYDRRLGLDRAQVVFPHPILYGLFCSLCLAAAFVGMRNVLTVAGRWIRSAFVMGCVFLSVSTGPLLSTLVQIFLMGWSIVFATNPRRWKILLSFTAVGYVIAEIGSDRPAVYAIVSRLALNPATAFNRRLIFEYGIAQVAQTPVFGVGLNTWSRARWMTDSVDNYWLALAIQFGIPAFAFSFAAFVIAMVLVGRRHFTPGSRLWNVQLAWVVTMVSITLTLATVYVWNEVASLVFLIFGAGQFLIFASAQEAAPDAGPVADSPKRMKYTRFPSGSPPEKPSRPLRSARADRARNPG